MIQSQSWLTVYHDEPFDCPDWLSCMYVWVFMALITTLVLCARSQDSLLSVSMRRVLVVISTLLDLRAKESRVLRQVKPPRYGEASRKPRALSWDRILALIAIYSFQKRALLIMTYTLYHVTTAHKLIIASDS